MKEGAWSFFLKSFQEERNVKRNLHLRKSYVKLDK